MCVTILATITLVMIPTLRSPSSSTHSHDAAFDECADAARGRRDTIVYRPDFKRGGRKSCYADGVEIAADTPSVR